MPSYDVSTLQVIFQSTSMESIEVQLQSIWFECSTYARIILILSASAENWGWKTVGTFDKSSKSREKGINNINGRNVYNKRWPCYAKTPLESMLLFWLLPISLVIIWSTNSAIVTQFPTLSFHLPQVAALIVLGSCFKCQRVKHFPCTARKWADSFVSDISQKKTLPEITKKFGRFFQRWNAGVDSCDSSTQPGDAQMKTNTHSEICWNSRNMVNTGNSRSSKNSQHEINKSHEITFRAHSVSALHPSRIYVYWGFLDAFRAIRTKAQRGGRLKYTEDSIFSRLFFLLCKMNPDRSSRHCQLQFNLHLWQKRSPQEELEPPSGDWSKVSKPIQPHISGLSGFFQDALLQTFASTTRP